MLRFLVFACLAGCALSQACVNVNRAGWGARPPTSSSSIGTRRRYIIHHSAGASCSTQSTCSQQVRNIQSYHMDSNGWSDIGYNFLVGEDGNVYEGRGWNNLGAHAGGCNTGSIGICVIGDFTSRAPNSAAQTAVRNLMSCGVSNGFLPSSYGLHNHRDVTATACPGNSFYGIVQSWPNYSSSASC